MRKFAEQRRRLERLEAKQPPGQPCHTVIYDVESGEPLNGPVPDSATTVIYIPHNHRENLYDNE